MFEGRSGSCTVASGMKIFKTTLLKCNFLCVHFRLSQPLFFKLKQLLNV